MAFQAFNFEHTEWRLFLKHVVLTKLDIYVFILIPIITQTSIMWWRLSVISCDEGCQWSHVMKVVSDLMWWRLSVISFRISLFSPVSSFNKADRKDITEILLKMALNTYDRNHCISLLLLVKFKFTHDLSLFSCQLINTIYTLVELLLRE